MHNKKIIILLSGMEKCIPGILFSVGRAFKVGTMFSNQLVKSSKAFSTISTSNNVSCTYVSTDSVR